VAAVELLAEAFLNHLPTVTRARIGFEILETIAFSISRRLRSLHAVRLPSCK